MYCVTMQASTVDHGQWNRGRSCLEGMRSHRSYSVNVVTCSAYDLTIVEMVHSTDNRNGG